MTAHRYPPCFPINTVVFRKKRRTPGIVGNRPLSPAEKGAWSASPDKKGASALSMTAVPEAPQIASLTRTMRKALAFFLFFYYEYM